jgi:ATP/maltotriose-dependent transcriptional regulator MalT
MSTNLLASKFYFPPHRPDLVPRPGLLENLDAGLRGKLTLVSAPAGFGKTTAVSEWLRYCGRPAAWLSVDKNDNDLSRFLIYLIAALQRIDAEIGDDVQAALEETLSPHFDILLTRLISEIEKFPDKSIIVLDDFHLINSKQVHDALNFLIEFLPPVIHLVISGRMDPPLPISRLRVRGDVNEIRTPQLRFTKDEVATYLNDLLGFDLSTDGIAALETRTEGWIASLKLAALSMQGRDDWTEFITKFSGSNRYIIDYLVDEVMARQPEEVQTFLRRTSILERFCAPLCEYVIGGHGDNDVLDYIERANLCLIPLDDHREWYRYHHLFADFLNQRLHEIEPERITELHLRASQWFTNAGLVDEAIQHALTAGDLEGATRLVDRIAIDLIVRREPNKLLRLISQLPYDLYKSYPILCIIHAFALVFAGQLDKVEPALALAEADHNNVGMTPNHGYVTTVRAYLANHEGDLLKAIKLSEQALDELQSAPINQMTLIFQGSAVIWLGVNHRHLGNLDKAKQLFVEAAEINQKAGNYYAALASYEQQAQLAMMRGQLLQAVEFYEEGLNLAQNWLDAEGKPRGSLIAAAGLQRGLGTVLYQLNDLAGATIHIQRSANLYELGELWRRVDAYTMLAQLRLANGDIESSIELLNKAIAIEDTVTDQSVNTTDLPSLVRLRILLSRAKPGMDYLLADAIRRMDAFGLTPKDEVDFSSPSGYPREYIYSDLAYLLIAQNQATEALPLLTRLLHAAVKMGRHGDEIRYLVMIAMAQHASRNDQNALDCLHKALDLAEPQGYVRLFIDEGQPMMELLLIAISRNVAPEYASKLLAEFPTYVLKPIPLEQKRKINAEILAEPLSERELEVIRLMADGYKYREIAERLVVSINTVRYHTRNVYGKLSANNRTQAISRAKELSLL